MAVKFLFAEEQISSRHVLDKIEDMIQETAFGRYDVTSSNANVTGAFTTTATPRGAGRQSASARTFPSARRWRETILPG
jgi:hypothetical protein